MKRQSGAKAMALAVILFSTPSTTLASLISNIPLENCPAFCVDRSIEVLGYAGDGAIQLADFGNGEVVGSSVIGVGNINLAHDVTSFINGLRSSCTAFAGFSAGCQIQD